MIERPYYIDRLKRLRGPGLAKVLTGMRRAGKSGILRLLSQQLLDEGAGPNHVLLIDLELMQNEPLRDPQALLSYVRHHLTGPGTSYVLIDEAQEARGMGAVAYALLEEGRFDVYLTGSHTRLVERELADVLAGRYVEVPVFPLSFAEYHGAHGRRGTSLTTNQLFQRYLTNGGLPHVLGLEDDPYALHDYLDGVYHTVVRKDVATGLGHEDPALLDDIARQLMTGIGEAVSANGIARELSSSGRPCSDDTVALYLGALAESYAFHRVRRLDLRSQALLKTKEKVYAADLGLRTLMAGAGTTSLVGLLENVVYLELRRRFGQVHQGRHYRRTITFVAQGAAGREYFEVAPSVLDPATLERELAPLRAERDNYPKTLLTLDEIGTGSHDGIRQRNVVEWLLDV